jgi:hypothetical protein
MPSGLSLFQAMNGWSTFTTLRAGGSDAHLAEQVAAANGYGRHASCLRRSHAGRSRG